MSTDTKMSRKDFVREGFFCIPYGNTHICNSQFLIFMLYGQDITLYEFYASRLKFSSEPVCKPNVQ